MTLKDSGFENLNNKFDFQCCFTVLIDFCNMLCPWKDNYYSIKRENVTFSWDVMFLTLSNFLVVLYLY